MLSFCFVGIKMAEREELKENGKKEKERKDKNELKGENEKQKEEELETGIGLGRVKRYAVMGEEEEWMRR